MFPPLVFLGQIYGKKEEAMFDMYKGFSFF
jgi:hypothetical protein